MSGADFIFEIVSFRPLYRPAVVSCVKSPRANTADEYSHNNERTGIETVLRRQPIGCFPTVTRRREEAEISEKDQPSASLPRRLPILKPLLVKIVRLGGGERIVFEPVDAFRLDVNDT